MTGIKKVALIDSNTRSWSRSVKRQMTAEKEAKLAY